MRAIANNDSAKDTLSITVLPTSDFLGQLDTHPKLFREDEEIVIKDRGGLANIKTFFDRARRKKPDRTTFVDSADLVQGSGYTGLSKGKVISIVFTDI